MQPQSLSPNPQLDEFCAQVKSATGHECRPYRAGVYAIARADSERIVTFQADHLAQFDLTHERIIKPALDALYQ